MKEVPFTERSLVIIKPDAVVRGLIGEIISRLEKAGLKIIGAKMIQATLEQAKAHYPMSDAQLNQMGGKTIETYKLLGIDPLKELGTDDPKEIGAMVHSWNAEFLASGPVMTLVVEGVHAVKKIRTLCGSTMPKDAAPGTIRGDYSSSSPAVSNMLRSAVYNMIHASDNNNDPDEPTKEINHWFSENELVSYIPVSNLAMYKIQ